MSIKSKIESVSYVKKNIYSVIYDNGIGVRFKTNEDFSTCTDITACFLGMKGVDLCLKTYSGEFELTDADKRKYAENSLETVKKRQKYFKRNKTEKSQ